MQAALRLLGGEIEGQPEANDEVTPPRLSTRGDDGRGQGEPPIAPNDRGWAVAFKLNVAITVISAVCFHKTALTALGNTLESQGWIWSEESHGGAGAIVMACMLVVPSAYALSRVLFLVVSGLSPYILQLSFAALVMEVFVVAVFLVDPIGLHNPGAMLVAVVLAIVSAVTTGVFALRRGRLDFAAANLKVAVLAVEATPQILSWALCTMAFRVTWLVVAGIASFGSVTAFQTVLSPDGETYRAVDCFNGVPSESTPLSCQCNGNVISDNSGCEYSSSNPLLTCFWIASVGWSTAVTANVVAATVADSVATWWSSPGDVGNVWASFHRVMHSSLGSVSKATVIYDILLTLHYVVNNLLLAFSWISCPLSCVRCGVAYMVENTVFFIGMYRLRFSEAAHRAWALFRKDGLTFIFKRLVVTLGMSLILLAGFAIVSFTKVTSLVSSLPDIVAMIICSAVFLTIVATFEVVLWAFKAVYICFLQNPEEFSGSHDRWLYGDIYRGWRELKLPHPTLTEEQGAIQV